MRFERKWACAYKLTRISSYTIKLSGKLKLIYIVISSDGWSDMQDI